MTQKQLEVQIMGQSYLLACPEGGEQRLLEAVEKVDTAMCRIRDAGKVKARDRIAVLAALNLAFDISDRLATPFQASGFAPSQLPADGNGNSHERGSANDPANTDASGHASGKEQPDARLTQLMQRLDGALGDDGRLI
jgi:cell division protein ZapA